MKHIGMWLGIAITVTEEKHKQVLRWGDDVLGEWRRRENKWKWIPVDDEAIWPEEVKEVMQAYTP